MIQLKLGNKTAFTLAAFTLAEVLVTLGIIGIVATLTIPLLINQSQKQSGYSGLKKEYSTLAQATSQIVSDSGGTLNWTSATDMMNSYLPYLKYTSTGTMGDVFNYTLTGYDSRTGTINIPAGTGVVAGSWWINYFIPPSAPAISMNDGSIIGFNVKAVNCTDYGGSWGGPASGPFYCGFMFVDVNGTKPPNRIGVDFYFITVTKDTTGIKLMSPPGMLCQYTGGDYGWWQGGMACTEYVIENKDMPIATGYTP